MSKCDSLKCTCCPDKDEVKIPTAHVLKIKEALEYEEQCRKERILTEGMKHDTGKYDPTMLSQEMLELVSRVRMFGAKKYSRNNWKKGFKITRSLAAAMRHIISFMNGEDNDPESGLSHLGHAICGLEHAIYDSIHHKENDDRKEE